MIYAVDRYIDQIRVKAKREYDSILKQEKYHYFESENEARAFVRKRSLDAYYELTAQAEKARLKHNRNCKKYAAIKSDVPTARESE